MSDNHEVGPHMFGQSAGKLLKQCELDKLKVAMLDPPTPPDAENSSFVLSGSRWIPAAYTYLFQFIAHDIVPETSRSATRQVTPQLNLDSVYGQGGLGYDDSLFDESGKFIHRNAHDFDVWRRPDPLNETDFLPGIPELRNNENVIVVQLHRLFQKLHNKLIDRSSRSTRQEKISEARGFTLAIFHNLVIDDALKVMLNSSVYDFYFRQYKQFYYRAKCPIEKLPAEFSHGAFRFGHSMVLPDYMLQKNVRLPLKGLLLAHLKQKLPKKMEINWNFFFNTNQVANPVDLKVTAHLGNVGHGVNLVERNLVAGENAALQSAELIIDQILSEPSQFEEFAKAFQLKLKNWALDLSPTRSDIEDVLEILRKTTSQKRTPLWLAVLHENANATGSKAFKLGLLGSAIVGDVLRQSIYSMYAGSDYQTQTVQLGKTVEGAWSKLELQPLPFEGLLKYLTR